MPNINPTLNVPQSNFLQLDNKFRAFVAGFGSGKTWVGCSSLCDKSWEFPKVPLGYFAPTYPQIRDIFFPTIDEVAFDWGLKTKIYESNKEVDIYYGRQYRSTIICRSMEKPQTIVGFKIGHALIDELDVMPMVKAQQAWRKIIARMRYKQAGLLNGIDVATTPEGFKFTYEQFVKEASSSDAKRALYGMIQASTYDNEKNLPDDYISSLRESYPPQLIEAYLRGQFINLTSGAVYPEFSRKLNHTDETIHPSEPLHIGMDFNVLKMSAVVYVIRNGLPIALDEMVGVRDTPAMAELIKERYQSIGHHITVYPDASGQNTTSKSASISDLSILQQAGFTIKANSVNPRVKDRVNAVNAMICNANGERRFKVNTHKCPTLTECMEQQAYDKFGEPDKSTGHDHANDAMGYPIAFLYPVNKPIITHGAHMPHMSR
ncbi:terminase large subunit domain-containing protein [Acinetobacter sp. ANC 4641]|uniref:terminase large subunit domain-containing protein n=1 Tax=Acinetobacter sp. ANC 4641 TaxID=2529847 RepID=UPI001039CB71|nr:terminase family protein [Acinetobacter sp. ANC 4641]TCB11448.1 terminase [Acinetobacter sp. ANC 4641]